MTMFSVVPGTIKRWQSLDEVEFSWEEGWGEHLMGQSGLDNHEENRLPHPELL